MKRFLTTAIFVVIVCISFIHTVEAASPTPGVTTVPTINFPAISPRKVQNAVPNQRIDQSPQETTTDTNVIYTFSPVSFFSSPHINTLDFKKLNNIFASFEQSMTSLWYKERVKKQENNLYLSGWPQRCKTTDGRIIAIPAAAPYKSQVDQGLADLNSNTDVAAALTTKRTLELTDDTYNLNWSPLEVANPPPCGSNAPQTESAKSSTVQLARPTSIVGEIISFLLEAIGTIVRPPNQEIVSNQLIPYADKISCSLERCGSDLSSLDNEAEAKNIREGGGAARALAIERVDMTKGGPKDSASNNSLGGVTIKTTNQQGNVIQNSVNYIKCTLTTEDQQKKLGINCLDYIKKSCDEGLPDLTVEESACEIRNPETINQYAEVHLPQDNIPPTMLAIINKAADTYKVPGSSILAVLGHEQGFNRSWISWTEENVMAWSFCGEKMDFCSDAMDGPAQPPYGFFANWFYKDAGEGTLWSAVQKVDPSRTRDNISLCNFMDVTFAVAKALSIDAAFRPPKDATLTTCFGLPITNTRRATTCSRSAWTNAVILQSHVSYAGYCPEIPGRAYPYTENAIYDQLIFKFTDHM